ncbi:FMN-binding split barrel protein [Rutstroemia sp. NJR-2017a BVV2]|nr:FMN-binding split barrel protein [Rutstroemia sp. NJR-2017a BVV2]
MRWISTRSANGKDNLAPYSQFNNLTFDPPYVMFSANQTHENERKDTTVNAETTGSFAWNICTWDLRHAMNVTSEQLPYGTDEFQSAGLEKVMTNTLKHPVPMVANSPIRFECTYYTTLRLPGNPPMGTVDVIIGRVVGVHIADSVLTDGLIDLKKVQPVARCGYHSYTVVRETFEMGPPGDGKMAYGLEGSAEANSEEQATREKKGVGAGNVEDLEVKV